MRPGSIILPSTRRRTRRAVLAAALVIVAAVPSSVAGHAPDPVLGGFFDQGQVLTFDWRAGSVPPDAVKTAIKAAAADVDATRASQAATFTLKAGAPNPIGYGVGATCGVNGIACFTRNAPVGFTMWFREHGHQFDWGTLKWCQSQANPQNGCFDVETVALDEFGHIEGLGHHTNFADDSDYLDAVVQTISHAKPAVGWNMHTFGPCDVATLQRGYDVPNTSTLISTCLDLDTTLSIAVTPFVVPAGSAATLSATLKVAGNAAYDRLKNNPLSGRSVTLQRRTTGTTPWITVGTMGPGPTSGTYIQTHRPTAPTQYRAVFSALAAEGLDASTSAVVSVTIGACSGRACPTVVSPAARGSMAR